jgi:hypothetical protein
MFAYIGQLAAQSSGHLLLLHFFNYFESNYLNGIFVPQMWNVYERNMDTRTNNYVEANYLNGIFVPQMWNVHERNMDTRTNN